MTKYPKKFIRSKKLLFHGFDLIELNNKVCFGWLYFLSIALLCSFILQIQNHCFLEDKTAFIQM